jgi:cytochrome P450
MNDTNFAVPPKYRGIRLLLAMKRDPLKFFVRLMNEEGAFARLRINGRNVLMLNDATGIEHVLQSNSANYFKGHFQRMMKPLFGDSVLLQEGEVWRQRRHNAAPVFASGNFIDISGQMAAAVEAMFVRWDEKIIRGEPIDITTEMTRFTLDALLRSLFHNAHGDTAAEMRAAMGTMLRDVENRLWSALQLPRFIAHRLPRYKKARVFLRSIVKELIETRRQDRTYPQDLLSRLIAGFGADQAQQKALFDEVLSYVLAGHETTAHGLAWTLYNLSLYPLVLRGVENEVGRVLGRAAPDMESVKELHYTHQVLDEVFRLFPPVWTMSREAIAADSIPLDDGGTVAVSAGESIMMCHYAVHRREKYWPSPEAFDPDRFTPNAIKARPKFAWFPFGGGPRLCLGFRFAQVESLIALAMIVQRYQFSLISGQNVEPEPIITLRPKTAILFKMQKRAGFAPAQAAPAPVPATPRVSKCPFH